MSKKKLAQESFQCSMNALIKTTTIPGPFLHVMSIIPTNFAVKIIFIHWERKSQSLFWFVVGVFRSGYRRPQFYWQLPPIFSTGTLRYRYLELCAVRAPYSNVFLLNSTWYLVQFETVLDPCSLQLSNFKLWPHNSLVKMDFSESN